ncbi:TPR repeat [Paenibacillus sp. 1_12]|uniref:SEC-C metal-binding domain-containing protein n=1 Tax=Paenibacillus sp. 1_12 TaxID=1566278 RepID=UPI0008E6FFF3|nr:SEC-C metal-binding domain-containing protein [Paenibacillus sp. 1_12]SFM37862.1 TPR repeat [Paenibacillus sp. 1_12]
MLTGRNDLCPCGSGKKYKKCCLHKNEQVQQLRRLDSLDQMRRSIIEPILGKPLPETGLTQTRYVLTDGYRSYLLGRLEQLTTEFKNNNVRDDVIISLCGDLYNQLDQGKWKYTPERSASKFDSLDESQNRAISRNEYIMLLTVVEGILVDYAYLAKGAIPDHGAMYVCSELAFRVLDQGLSDKKKITKAIIHVDTGDSFDGWELFEGETYEIDNRIWIDFHSKDELENRYKMIRNEWYGLSDQSQKTLATAMILEVSMESLKSGELLSYQGIAMNYFGVIEEELRSIILQLEHWPNSRRMMWRDLCEYCHTHTIPNMNQYIPDLGSALTDLLPLRNRAAHGGFVSKDEFSQIKELVFERNLLSYLSWAKVGEEPRLKSIHDVSEILNSPETQTFEMDVEGAVRRAIKQGHQLHISNAVNESSESKPSITIPQLYTCDCWFEQVEGVPKLRVSFTYNDGGKQTEEAFHFYKQAAENGGVDAAFVLAHMYSSGSGTNKDDEKAIRWCRIAAQKNNRDAQFLLGTMLQTGEAGTKKPQEALQWLLQAGELGHVGSMYQLISIFSAMKDDKNAFKWTEKLAERGYKQFQFNLACKLETGEGVEKDTEAALRWYIKSARQGCVEAQFNLGVMYAEGEDAVRNVFEAMKWFRKAAERGDDEAKEELMKLMSQHSLN